MFSTFIKYLGILLCAFALTACGGGGAPESSQSPAERLLGTGGGGGDSTTGGGDSTGGGSGSGVDDVIRIGSGTGADFTQGQLGITNANLQAGESTTIVVNLVNGEGVAIAQEVTVEFTSDCLANGLATFTPVSATTSAGRATTAYTANGCSGTDVITARADVNGVILQASSDLTVEADQVLAILYVSSEPEQMTLKGMGGNQTSRVTFKLVGAQGAPIIGEDVRFLLSTTAGGVNFAPGTEIAVSDNQGQVSTVVQSGTVSTVVRVTAEHMATGVRGKSGDLVISTGVPVDSGFSLSLSDYVPAGALGTDGIEVTVSIIASDQFGNDAFNGTHISFWSPGPGNIDKSCVLESGRCSITWISSGKRPADGRATIIAYTNGAEDFIDQNGNHIFESSDLFPVAYRDCNFDGIYDSEDDDLLEPTPATPSNLCPGISAISSYDLGEAYADQDEDGQYDVGEYFVDVADHPLGASGARDSRTNLVPQEWDGPCVDEQLQPCSGRNSVTIWEEAVIIHSDTSGVGLFDFNGNFASTDCSRPVREALPVPPGSTLSAAGGPVTLEAMWVSDATLQSYLPCHIIGNPLPSGTTIEFSTDNGEIVGSDSWEVPTTAQTATRVGPVTIKPDDESSAGGTLEMTITPPDASLGGAFTRTWTVVD